MAFWTFMTICNSLIPVMMIVIGIVLVKCPPKSINGIYGYRTIRSRKSQDTWDFAQLCCGKLWRKNGWIMLPLSFAGMLPALGKGDAITGTLGGVIAAVECMILIGSIFSVEKALKKNFDKDGKPLMNP